MRQSGVEDDPSSSTGEPSASSHSPVVKLSSRIAAGQASDRRILYWLRLKFASLSRARQRLVARRPPARLSAAEVRDGAAIPVGLARVRVAMASAYS